MADKIIKSGEELIESILKGEKKLEVKLKEGHDLTKFGSYNELRGYLAGDHDRIYFRQHEDHKRLEFYKSDLKGLIAPDLILDAAYIAHSDFSGAVLDYFKCRDSYLYEVNFEKAKLNNSEFVLSLMANCNFKKGSLNEANFISSRLREVSFEGAYLPHSYFSFVENQISINYYYSEAKSVNFSKTDLRDSSFNGSNLVFPNFSYADLTGSDINYSYFYHPNFTRAKLLDICPCSGAYFLGGDFSGCDLRHTHGFIIRTEPWVIHNPKNLSDKKVVESNYEVIKLIRDPKDKN